MSYLTGKKRYIVRKMTVAKFWAVGHLRKKHTLELKTLRYRTKLKIKWTPIENRS